MLTDSGVVLRLAGELDRRLRGLRVQDGGLIDDGRPALVFGAPGSTLVLDPFASPPVVFLDSSQLSVQGDPGYLRAIATALRGMRVAAVGTLPGERILTVDFAARSRFGVPDAYRLIIELIPRFGNVILLKDQTVVAAAKQFGPAENERRTILVGKPYNPPPARPVSATRTAAGSRNALPEDASVLDALRQVDARQREGEQQGALVRRRETLRKRITRRIGSLRAEHDRLIVKRNDATARDRLRAEGEALYAFSHLVPPRASTFAPPTDPGLEITLDPALDAKANAAAIFSRYRKLVDGLPHLERRLSRVETELAALDELEWQLDGADDAVLTEIGAAFAPRRVQPGRAPERRRKHTPPRYALPSGARMYVGHSPEENARITFQIARPSDIWFHARGQPGAHVVLQPAPGKELSATDLDTAAAAAAFFSKGRSSEGVAIDFVARKHVRKQHAAAPGRVWYTNAQTLFVAPRDPSPYIVSGS